MCWLSFWFVAFPCKDTKFNATFIFMRRYTMWHLFFFFVVKGVTSFHSFVQCQFSLDKYEILQPIRTDSALCLTHGWNSLELEVEREIWCLEVWSFFFCKVYSENVNKIVHFMCHCIHHSVLFWTVLMICINDFCNSRTVNLKWVRGSSETHVIGYNTAAQRRLIRVQRGRLHWQWLSLPNPWLMHFIIRLLTLAFKKDFKRYLLNNLSWTNLNQ